MRKNDLKVSIITPSFNQGQFIERTILSVISQTYENVEYLIIDGGSSDRTLNIIGKYSASIHYWISEPDGGQSHAVNKGLKKASGDIIGWLNSDDMYFSEDVIEFVVNLFMEHPEIDVCYGHNIYIDDEDKLIFCRAVLPFFSGYLLKSWNFINQPTVFFRSKNKQDLFLDESLSFCMDYELWLRLSRKSNFLPVFKIISASRWHSQSKTVAKSVLARDELMKILSKNKKDYGYFQRLLISVGYSLLRIFGIIVLILVGKQNQSEPFDLPKYSTLNVLAYQIFGVRLRNLLQKNRS